MCCLIDVGIVSIVAYYFAERCGIISHVGIGTTVNAGSNRIESVSIIETIHLRVDLACGRAGLGKWLGKGCGWTGADTHRFVVGQ